MADNLNTRSLTEVKPLSRRDVMAGAAATAVGLLPIAAVTSAPQSFEDGLEAVLREAEAGGYKFVVSFEGNKSAGLYIRIAGAEGDLAPFNEIWASHKKRVTAHLIATGRHNRRVVQS